MRSRERERKTEKGRVKEGDRATIYERSGDQEREETTRIISLVLYDPITLVFLHNVLFIQFFILMYTNRGVTRVRCVWKHNRPSSKKWF